jgi:peptidoglycan/xylan/chitin deacetylase (PgdA/CDA1 family)
LAARVPVVTVVIVIVESVPAARPRIALTFDDGPCVPFTRGVLAAFAEHGGRATFFIRGGALGPQTRDLVLQAQAAGHEIGNHTERHLRFESPDGTPVDDAIIRAEIEETHAKLAAVTGERPLLVRPPYGLALERVDAVATPLGYRATVGWSIDARDWKSPRPERIVGRLLGRRRVLAGAILLLHDGSPTGGGWREPTVIAVHQLLPRLKALGLEPVTVSQLLDAAS